MDLQKNDPSKFQTVRSFTPPESAGGGFDLRSLRQCLGQFGTGVTVVTTASGEERYGVTANSFSSVSLEPPLVLWSIKRTSRSFAAFQSAEHFAVNVLSVDQIDVSQSFASQEGDKFEGIACKTGKTGVPLIENAIAVFECKAETIHDGGDHIIIIGRVVAFERNEGDALLFCQGRYAVAFDHPDLRPSSQIQVTVNEADGAASFWRLMFLAQHRMSQRFEKHRQEEGLTAAESRLLAALSENADCNIDQIVTECFLTRQVVKDALCRLSERGYVHLKAKGRARLTASGVHRRAVMAARWQSFEREELAGVGPHQLSISRDVLSRILARTDDQATS